MRRVVLDTNVLVSGIISSKGSPRKILKLWQEKKILVVISPEIINEVIGVLNRPKIRKEYRLTNNSISHIRNSLEKDCLLVRPGGRHPRVVNKDPGDDKFVHCALVGEAKWIVSGDKHLLSLKSYKKINIVSPGRFLETLGDL